MSFLEKYQVFFAIIIVGILLLAGILLAHFLPAHNSNQAAINEATETQSQVRSDLVKIARKEGLNSKTFAMCLDNHTNQTLIANDVTLAQASGVQGTPTFYILKRTFNADGSVATTKQFEILGAVPESIFESSITSGTSPAGQPTQPAGQKIVLSSSDHYEGPANAPVVIVEYADLDCPFCKAEYPVIQDILKNNPTYALVFRQSPIVQLHPWAEYTAEASECAYQQGGDTAFFKFLGDTMGAPQN